MMPKTAPTSLLALLLLLLCMQTAAVAQYSIHDFTDPRGLNAGRSVAHFLTLPHSGFELAFGPVAFGGSGDATDVAIYPAATTRCTGNSFALTHLEWLMGLRKEYAGACFPVPGIGTLGASTQVFTPGKFEYARDIDEYPSRERSMEAAAGLSFARSFLDRRVAAGISASYIESRLAGHAGRGVSATLDASVSPLPWTCGRIYLRNLGSGLRYNETRELLPLQAGFNAQVTPPIALDSIGNTPIELTIGLGAQKTIDRPLLAAVGVDCALFDLLSVRGGYEYAYGRSFSTAGLSAGLGLDISAWSIDAGWRYQSAEFGSVWALSAAFEGPETMPLSAMDHYTLALRAFNRGHYRTTIMRARMALAINPTLWEAHALVSRTLAIQRRRQGSELAIIYSHGVNGEFLPAFSDQGAIGGLARQAAAIRQLRSDYPLNVVIEGGSIIAPRSDSLRTALAGLYLNIVNPDAHCLGSNELAYGMHRFCRDAQCAPDKLLCANLTGADNPATPDVAIISRDRYRIAVMSGISPLGSVAPQSLSSLIPALQKAVSRPDVARCDLRIAVVHGSWQEVQLTARSLPQVNVIVCAGLQEPFQAPMRVDSTILISTGSRGRAVGALTLRFDESRHLHSFDNRLIQLNERIAGDHRLESEIMRMSAALNEDTSAADTTVRTAGRPDDGVFVFVSDRRGWPCAYVKVLSRHIEAPLCTTANISRRPRLCPEKHCALFLEECDSSATTNLRLFDLGSQLTRDVALPGSVRDAEFSPDGDWIYVTLAPRNVAGSDIWRVNARTLHAARPVIAWNTSNEHSITVSPDNRKIMFVSDREGSPQIYVSDTAGNVPVRIIDERALHLLPQFSPSGRYCAFLSDRFAIGKRMLLMVHDLHQGVSVRLNRNSNAGEFCWLDTDETIVYSRGREQTELIARSVFRNESRILIPTRESKQLSESVPRRIDYAGQVRILYTTISPQGDRAIFMAPPQGGSTQCVVDSKGSDWLE